MDSIDSGIEINDFVFDDKNKERPPWKMFGSEISRSAVVFFCQTLMIFLVFSVASLNLTINYQKIDLTSFWTGLLGAAVGSILPYPKK